LSPTVVPNEHAPFVLATEHAEIAFIRHKRLMAGESRARRE
jgi:hypothetical protein